MVWATIDLIWQEAFRQAWEALRTGMFRWGHASRPWMDG